MEKIEIFNGDYEFLSNFYPCKVTWEGIEYPSSEHAYVAAKTLDRYARAFISTIPTAAKVKAHGRKLELRPDWDLVKFDIMWDIVYEKFLQNPELKKKLLATGDAILEEGNWWGDKIWGISPAGSGVGENRLGIALMEVREHFLSEEREVDEFLRG